MTPNRDGSATLKITHKLSLVGATRINHSHKEWMQGRMQYARTC
jgi:hypothetical protein